MYDDFLEVESQHAKFAPSYSATWLNCAGSLLPSLDAPDIAGRDAAIGTVFHLVMAEWLDKEARPIEWYGRKFRVKEWEVVVDEDMFNFGQECWDYFDKFEGDYWIEVQVDISDLTPIPEQFGTADVVFCQPGILDVIDWKYGTGVQIFARHNTQLLLYAWGVFLQHDAKYKFERIRLRIAQPRLNHWDTWEISRSDLQAFAAYARERAAAAWVPNADRTPGPKQCQWCRVTSCAAVEVLRERMAAAIFDEFTVGEEDMRSADSRRGAAGPPPPPPELTTAQLETIYAYRKLFERWFAQVGEELINRYRVGEELSQWKAVEARTRRRWRDEAETVEMFGMLGIAPEALYDSVIKSPNQSLKLLQAAKLPPALRKQWLDLLVVRPPGRLTLAPLSDNREEQPPENIEGMFDYEEEAGDGL